MKKNIYILIYFVALLACNESGKNKAKVNKTNVILDNNPIDYGKIQDKPGVEAISKNTLDSINIVALKEDYSKGLINIYNYDGTIWKTFEISDNFSDNAIIPYVLKPENNIMVFRVVGYKNNQYSIVVNEEKNIVKYIKPSIPYFNYETWQQYILKSFSVDFSIKDNPLKTEPFITSKTLPFKKDQFYHPVEIKGDWLKVKDDDDKKGWIKWRDEKGRLIIQIFYDA